MFGSHCESAGSSGAMTLNSPASRTLNCSELEVEIEIRVMLSCASQKHLTLLMHGVHAQQQQPA